MFKKHILMAIAFISFLCISKVAFAEILLNYIEPLQEESGVYVIPSQNVSFSFKVTNYPTGIDPASCAYFVYNSSSSLVTAVQA